MQGPGKGVIVNSMILALFEDEFTRNLNPLAHLRPVYDLKFGIRSIREKYLRIFGDEFISLHCRAELASVMADRNPKAEINTYSADKYIFINGRSVIPEKELEKISSDEDLLYTNNGKIAAAVLTGDNLKKIRAAGGKLLSREDFPDLNEKAIKCLWLDYPWELFLENGNEIEREFEGPKMEGNLYDSAVVLNSDMISVSEGVKIKPGTVLDAEEGPIIIAPGVHIMSNSVIQGPVYIGENSVIKAGARIYGSTSIGEECKVGGEVSNSIIHSYSNKQHDGYLGNSYIGKWVNLGADSNNSDLKNNYRKVKFYVDGKFIDTGTIHCGLIMGDHTKVGINTMFNTGTNVGTACNIYGGGFPPKFIPSFSWGGADGMTDHILEKAVDTAARVMERREVTLASSEIDLLNSLFDRTAAERNKAFSG